MSITVTCTCGKSMKVADQHAGKRGKCPACGAVVDIPAGVEAPAPVEAFGELDVAPVAPPPPLHAGAIPPPGGMRPLQYAGGGGGVPGAPVAPPPPAALGIRLPAEAAAKLRNPSAPPCNLFFNLQGTDVNANFDLSPVFQQFADTFAKKVKKVHDTRIAPPAPGTRSALVRVIRIDEGNQVMRYLLGIFFGGTVLEVDGQVISPEGTATPFRFKHVGRMGLFGGSGLALLKVNAKVIGAKVAKAALKA